MPGCLPAARPHVQSARIGGITATTLSCAPAGRVQGAATSLDKKGRFGVDCGLMVPRGCWQPARSIRVAATKYNPESDAFSQECPRQKREPTKRRSWRERLPALAAWSQPDSLLDPVLFLTGRYSFGGSGLFCLLTPKGGDPNLAEQTQAAKLFATKGRWDALPKQQEISRKESVCWS